MPAGAITLDDITSADWSLRLDATGQPGSGIGNVVQGLADVNQCIGIILTTPQGSDPLRPTFAADLWQFIDYPINSVLPAVVQEVTRALTLWEPRITIVSISAQPVIDSTAQSGAHLDIAVTWKLKLAGNSPGRIYSALRARKVHTVISRSAPIPRLLTPKCFRPRRGRSVYVFWPAPITQQPAPSPNPQATASSELMTKVINALSAGNVRPLTDTVTVSAVYEIDYAIAAPLLSSLTRSQSAPWLRSMPRRRTSRSHLLRASSDIVPSQIVEALSVPGVYQVALVSPLYAQLQPGQWANCIEIVLAQAVAAINS